MSKARILAVDTSTRASVVVLGAGDRLTVSHRDVQHRHGSHVLEQIDEVLGAADGTLDDVAALAVGTGPGSFTGLRVGLATVKTIAYARSLPLIGVMSSDALRLAAMRTGVGSEAVVVLPAGARDHYLAPPGVDPVLVAPGEFAEAAGGAPMLAIDMGAELVSEEAVRLGRAAVEGLPAAMIELARARLDAGELDDVADLTPAYVALPRGVKRAAEDLGWSPDLR